MPTRPDRAKRSRQRFPSELDWFAEDPWADPEPQEDVPDREADDEGLLMDDDGWGPIRPRRQSQE